MLQANINMLTTKIAELVRQSEKLGEEGDVDGSVAAAAQAETLKVCCFDMWSCMVLHGAHVLSFAFLLSRQQIASGRTILLCVPHKTEIDGSLHVQTQKANLEKEAADRAAKRQGSQQYVCEVSLSSRHVKPAGCCCGLHK